MSVESQLRHSAFRRWRDVDGYPTNKEAIEIPLASVMLFSDAS
jgi:hypothetical protein